VSSEPLVFFGPGSEWFWSMAQLILVVLTLIGLYRQLRVQGAANAVQRMEVLQGQWASEWLRYTRLTLAVALKDGEINNQTMVKARPLLNFFSNLDDLRQAGYIRAEEIVWSQTIQIWVAVLGPLVKREQVVHGNPGIYDLSELVAALRRADAKRGGTPRIIDSSAQREWLDFVIESITEELRVEEAWKSGVIPGPKRRPTLSEATAEAE